MRDPDGEEWLTPAEAAERLGIERDLVYLWVSRATGIRTEKIGRHRYVNMSDVSNAEHAWRTRRTGGHRRLLPKPTTVIDDVPGGTVSTGQ